MNTPPKLSFACPMPWTSMSGSERLKYCSQCGHHITNLSLLSAAERSVLLSRAQKERVCGSYFVRLSGEMVTPEAPLSRDEKRSVKQFGVAVLSAAALAVASGCVSSPAKKSTAVQENAVNAADVHTPPQVETPPSASTGDKVTKKNEGDVIILMGFVVSPQPAPDPVKIGK